MSELKIPLLFEKNEYIIDQRANLLKIGNTYDIVDTEGKKIGVIDQQIPGWHKLLLLVLDKQAFPYTYHFKDEKGNIGATVKRGWTYFMSKIQILDANNNVIGVIKEKFNLLAHNTFAIEDNNGNIIATIKSTDAGLKAFNITNANGVKMGTIEKKTQGKLMEIAAQALTPNKDKYFVNIDFEFTNDPKKIIALAGSLVVDMTFRN